MDVPILCMCRLCINYSQDCVTNPSNLNIRDLIRKYLNFEINDDESLPKSICQQCFDRIEAFDTFCDEVAQNQQLLQLSKLKDSSDGAKIIVIATNMIQLSPASVSNGNGTVIITKQTLSLAQSDTSDENIIISNDINGTDLSTIQKIGNEISVNFANTFAKPLAKQEKEVCINSKLPQIISSSIERELDDLAMDYITGDIHGASDDDDQYNDNESGTNKISDLNRRVDFKDFPTKLIEDTKLLYKGQDLLKMISKFYQLECELCSDIKKPIFESLSDLCQHYVDTHQSKGYVTCCDAKLIKPNQMAFHMARHLQPDAFKCPQCKKMLTCPKILQYHIQNHLPESQRPLACPQCPRKFSYSSALVAHAISHQPENQRVAHICDECGKIFASAGRLTTHVISHMKNSHDECHICGKKFSCRSNLAYHLTTHQPKIRQVQCSKCEKWFKNKFCLRKHITIQHSSVRYNCSMCDYSALNMQCFRNHLRVQHTNDKPFRCDVCGKAFKLKNTLRNHQFQHSGVRKFICPFCKRSFASSGNYYSHRKRMHPQELAAMKLKKEEEDRQLRERIRKSTDVE